MKLLFVTENNNNKVNELQTAMSVDGITRNVNIIPEGKVDPPRAYGDVVAGPPTDKLAGIPPQLKDWLYLTTLSITSTVATDGIVLSPYELFLELDYVKRVLTGRPVGKLCLELRFTAQPTAYHYGILQFSWLNNMVSRPTVWKAAAQQKSADYLASRKHNVRIDLAKPTVVVLRCPIVDGFGPLRSLTNNTTPNWALDVGQVWCNSMTGDLYRQDGAYTTVGVEVLCRLTEDSEVYGLTGASFYSISDRAEGPISSVLSAANAGIKAASQYGNNRFRDVLSPFEMVTRFGSGVARALGFGVPIVYDPPHRVAINIGGDTMISDGQNLGSIVSFSGATARGVFPGVGDDEGDECDISYICSRYGIINVVTIAAADAQGTVKSVMAVSPTYTNRTLFGSSIANPPSSVAWIGAYCTYWTGSLTYRLTVVASKYHSGRLRVTYDPDTFMNTTAPPSLVAQTHSFSEVFDIAEGVVVEFTVPWMQTIPWMYTKSKADSTLPGATYSRATVERVVNNGFLLLTIESALTSVAASPTSVFVIVEVKGGNDLEFAVPTVENCDYFPVSAKVGAEGAIGPRVLGSELPYKHKSLIHMGEKVTNVRQILKMMSPTGDLVFFGEGAAAADNSWFWWANFWPFYDDDGMVATASTADNVFNQGGSLTHPLIYFRKAFGLVSGGIRWKIVRPLFGNVVSAGVVNTASIDGPVVFVRQLESKAAPTYSQWGVGTFGHGNALSRTQYRSNYFNFGTTTFDLSKQAAEFTVPMRGPTYGLCGYVSKNGVSSGGAPMTLTCSMPGAQVGIVGSTGLISAAEILISAAAADDYNLMYYDGPPPCQ